MAVAPPQGHTAENFNVTGQGKVQIGDIYNYGSSREEQDCLQSLCPTGIGYEFQKDQNPKRVPETCLWTLQNPKYIEWRNDDAKKLLLISADPGCGKSVLARCIIDEDLRQAFQNDSSKRVLYYFFKDTSAEQRSATRALSAILHQLFVSQTRLIRHALPSYRKMGPALSTTFSKLWSIFTEAAVDRLAGDVICVFDALDECNEQEQPMLIKALKDFCLHQQVLFPTSRLKFLVTSRPYFTIRREFDELLEASSNIELAGNDESASIKKEIDIVIKERVTALARENRLAKKVKDHLEKRLLETEHRTYLWLRLLWEIIRKNLSGTITEMNELIDNLPAGIQESYEILLQRCPEPRFARKVLQIVLVAGRPLMLDEMDFALKFNEHTSSYADLELEEPSRLQETLPSRCGLMISIIHSKVYFIHQTVKDFLLGKVDIKAPDERTWYQSLSLEESHHLMADICLRSMAFSEIELSRAHIWNALLPELDREMSPNEYCRTHVFLSYTAIYWADHYRNINNCRSVKIVERFLKTNRCRSVFSSYGKDYGTVSIAASAGGHDKVVQILIDAGADVNAQGGYYGSALQAASEKGHEKVVQILIDAGADVNTQDGHHGNALQAASEKGHEKVVQILIDAGADVNTQDGHHGNALQAASEKGHEKVVQILIDAGADVNTQWSGYDSALQVASMRGYDKVVQILVGAGADVNTEGYNGNALQAASLQGHGKVVQILIDAGADVNTQGGFFGSALQAASVRGYDQVVKILIDAGADLNAKGGLYGNALRAASSGGHDQVVQILIDAGADVNTQDGHHGNALQAASEKGHEKVVQILIDAGADVNTQGGYYGNALQAASEKGHEKVVQILIDAGADVNTQDGHHGKALQAASEKGHEKVVQILIDAGADVNTEGYYGNALQAASAGGHEKVVQILIDAGADLNAQGGRVGNALQAASLQGHGKVVQILIDAGADVNTQGGFFGSALQAASAGDHVEAAQILIDAGADLNAEGGLYGNALRAASSGGHDQVVQILIDAGADVNTQWSGYDSALQVASMRGYDKVVQILVGAGADLNAKGYNGNALQAASAASANGHEKVVQILIDARAYSNAEDGYYGNALQAASAEGHEKVVQILIDAGADLNAEGGPYGNALQAASARTHRKVVQMLLAAGAGEPGVRLESRERRDKKRKFSNSP